MTVSKGQDSQSLGASSSPSEINRAPKSMIFTHLDGNGVGSKRGPGKNYRSQTVVTLSRSPVRSLQLASQPEAAAWPAWARQLRRDRRGCEERRACLLSAHMNNSKVKKQLPFLGGFFKPSFIN